MTAEIIALFIAGAISPFLITLIKKLFGSPEGLAAVWFSYGVASVIAVVAMLLTGGFTDIPGLDPQLFIMWIVTKVGFVGGLSQLVYKNLRSKWENL